MDILRKEQRAILRTAADGRAEDQLGKEEAKDIIDGLRRRMNEGERLTPKDVERALQQFIPA